MNAWKELIPSAPIISATVAVIGALTSLVVAFFTVNDRRKAAKSANEAREFAGRAATALDEIGKQHRIANEREGLKATDAALESKAASLIARCDLVPNVVNGMERFESRLIVENQSKAAAAKNVRIEADGKSIADYAECREKPPANLTIAAMGKFSILLKSVGGPASTIVGPSAALSRAFKLTLTWDDDFGQNRTWQGHLNW